MFDLTRTDIPKTSIGSFDDEALGLTDVPSWSEYFLTHLRATRTAGVSVRGIFYVSEDVAARIFGENLPYINEGIVRAPLIENPVQYDGLTIALDRSLPSDSVVLE